MSTLLGLSIGQAFLTSFPAAVSTLTSNIPFTPTDVKVVGTFVRVLKDQHIVDAGVAFYHVKHLEDKVLRGEIESVKQELYNLLQGARPNFSGDAYNEVVRETKLRLAREGISLFDEPNIVREKIEVALSRKKALDPKIVNDFEEAIKAIETAAEIYLPGFARVKVLMEVGPADLKVIAYVKSHPELFEFRHIEILKIGSRRNKDLDYALKKLEEMRPELFSSE